MALRRSAVIEDKGNLLGARKWFPTCTIIVAFFRVVIIRIGFAYVSALFTQHLLLSAVFESGTHNLATHFQPVNVVSSNESVAGNAHECDKNCRVHDEGESLSRTPRILEQKNEEKKMNKTFISNRYQYCLP